MLTKSDLEESPASATLPFRWLALHGDALYAYALRRVRDQDTAEDLVQETLLAGLRARDQYARRSNVRTWLIGILKHKIADSLRDRYRQDRLGSVAGENDPAFDLRGRWKVSIPRWNTDPATLMEQKEFRAVVQSCMAKLPTRMSHLFTSRLAGESTAELCQELGLSPDNAWMLLHRARSRLRQCLTVNWFCSPAKE